MGGGVRHIVTWLVALAGVALLISAGAVLTACGSGADPYSGTWLGPSPKAGGQRVVLHIEQANEGWWAVQMGSATSSRKPLYAAKVGDELQLPNRIEWMTVDGDTLTDTVSGLPEYPTTFTRE
jgi:hypothetical protein